MLTFLLFINTAAIIWLIWAVHMHNKTFRAVMEWQRLNGILFDDLALRVKDPLRWEVKQAAKRAKEDFDFKIMNGMD